MAKRHTFLAAATAALAAFAAPAYAHHPDHASGSKEMFEGEGVVHGDQHGGNEGHLPPVRYGVNLIGKAEVTNPTGAGNDGRVADVSAYGNYAFLTAFRDPTCERGGAHVIDMSAPRAPSEVQEAFMDTTPGNYAGEGSQTLRMKNRYFNGVLFIHNNETCPGAPQPTAPRTRGGINIWDVTDARAPKPLAMHAGDYTNPGGGGDDQANQTHSAFAWTNEFTGRTYVVLVDDEETTDLDIMDITNPRNPQLVNDSLDLDEPPFSVQQETPENLTSVFSHDMTVKKIGRRYVMNASYWDGGYVLLDVTDPQPGEVSLIAESDFPALDEQRLARGQEISPEGNAHQSEFSPDNRFLLGTDEDFNPYRVVATITSGPAQGATFNAASASATPPIDEETSITGRPTFVGTACEPLPAGSGVALIERGVCTFQQKLDTIEAAGYTGGIVFNAMREDCQGLITMLAEGDIPFVFTDRLAGLRLLQVAGVNETTACTTATPAPGTAAAMATIEAVFDGWGYLRLFGTDVPGRPGTTGSIEQIDTFAIPESQDARYSTRFGDLSVHEVAMDPDQSSRLAYVSYYAGGFRILRYGRNGLQEVGAFIDEGGNNFWGVEVHKMRGRQYVLASDRDYGLYIFRPRPRR
ncbi:MAG: hypothetical protein AVDCRST_MAG67-1376 [uncultured Solirubrobacteraceae bacterium]|uniref:PA domain-containing protein n=1 Tax=uncultured Solirubrobacteraceae bacterium TaxID=1162706 RepID=A0A6J4SGC6_9ACTN|nr:MAG: hypothetical protein AVDCRST_MAG67-1376 [uncultured Solirubrobacteraceae bacterium]